MHLVGMSKLSTSFKTGIHDVAKSYGLKESTLLVEMQVALLAYCQQLHVHISTYNGTGRALPCWRAHGQHT